MDLNLIPFGLIEATNEFVDVYDVEQGKKCNCICPSCRTPLIARHGDSNTWHFAHAHKGVYDKTKKECQYSFYLSVRLMARQLIDSKITLGLPECRGVVEKLDDELGYPIQESFIVTQEQDLTIEKVEVEKNFSNISVDLVGHINDFQFVIYFVHPGRGVPPELSYPKVNKCGVISVDLSSLPKLFSTARKSGKTYKDVLKDFLSTDRDSKKWIFHPNYKRSKVSAFEKLYKSIEKEKQLKAIRNKQFKFSTETTYTHKMSKESLIDAAIESYFREPKISIQSEFECIMCKTSWVGNEEGGNVCPKCGEYLYSRRKK